MYDLDCLINIVDSVFVGCRIKAVTLPDSLTSLGQRVFDRVFNRDVKLGPPTHPLLVSEDER